MSEAINLEDLPTGKYLVLLDELCYISDDKYYYDVYEFYTYKEYEVFYHTIKPHVLDEKLKSIRIIKNVDKIEFDDKNYPLSLESQTIYNIVKNYIKVDTLPEYYLNIINRIRIILCHYHKRGSLNLCEGDCKDFLNGTSCNICMNTHNWEELRYLEYWRYENGFPDIKHFFRKIYFYYNWRKKCDESLTHFASLTDIEIIRICRGVHYNLIITKSS